MHLNGKFNFFSITSFVVSLLYIDLFVRIGIILNFPLKHMQMSKCFLPAMQEYLPDSQTPVPLQRQAYHHIPRQCAKFAVSLDA